MVAIDPEKAARAAADVIQQLDPPSDYILVKEDVFIWGDISEPEGFGSNEAWKEHQLLVLQFRDHLRSILAEETGRYLKTVHGTGFQLLDAGESAPAIVGVALKRARSSLSNNKRLMKKLGGRGLKNSWEKQRQTDALARMGRLQQILKN